MQSLFWIVINLIGFIILVFMYAHKGKVGAGRTASRRLTEYLHLTIMLYLVSDTAMYMLDGAVFHGAVIIHYISVCVFFIVSVLPGFVYLIYCDSKVYAGEEGRRGFKRRVFLYSLPIIVNTLFTLLNPFTGLIFTINEQNIYIRGDYFWLATVVSFVHIIAVYPLLAIKTKKKETMPVRGMGLYFYLFPIPPLALACFQYLSRGMRWIGVGLFLSAFLIYLTEIQSSRSERSLSARFFYANIMQFSLFTFIMISLSMWLISSIADGITEDYAEYNSGGSASALKSYLNKEIGIVAAAARSKAVIDWFADERDDVKKQAAYHELSGSVHALYNKNIYVVVGKSGREYWLETDTPFEDFTMRGTLSPLVHKDAWAYELLRMPYEYVLNVDYAKGTEITDVWVNFKVLSDEKTVGILCTRMELSGLMEQVLSQFDGSKTRLMIIDENGVIQMDSALAGGEDNVFLLDNAKRIDEEIRNPEFLDALDKHFEGFDGYFADVPPETTVVSLYGGQYHYAAITPIGATNWTVVTLYDSSALFGITRLFVLFLIIAGIFIMFAFTSNGITQRLLFTPLKRLVDSLVQMRKDSDEDIYGIERSDEIGLLSNTIKDFFVKGHYDELTGIYNRRYFEITIQQVMATLSRSGSELSVLMIDIDHFKKYNDTYGHGEGDKCLKLIAETLNAAVMRKGDFVARYGGEEFAAVLPGTDGNGARLIAETMLEAVRALELRHDKNAAGIVTVSIGVTTGKNAPHHELMAKADKALYMSKADGRDRCTFLA